MKESRTLLWLLIKEYGLEINQQYLNTNIQEPIINSKKKLPTEQILDQFKADVPQGNAGSKKPAQSKPPAKPAAGKQAAGG